MNKKLLLVAISVVGVVVGVALGFKTYKGSKEASMPLDAALKTTLPKEAQDRVLINQDKINLGKQYISTVYITQDDSKAAQIVSDFIYTAYARIDSEEMKNMSAVNIVIYKDNADKTKARQYRVLLGSKVASRQGKDFWDKRDSASLFKWLTKECPKTSSVNLMEFCDISSSLKEQ